MKTGLPKIVALPEVKGQVKNQAKLAAEFLKKGQVIATPTDTIYGLAALANNIKAVRSIYDIKGMLLCPAQSIMCFWLILGQF